MNAESHNTSINCSEETTALSNVIRHVNKFLFTNQDYIFFNFTPFDVKILVGNKNARDNLKISPSKKKVHFSM